MEQSDDIYVEEFHPKRQGLAEIARYFEVL